MSAKKAAGPGSKPDLRQSESETTAQWRVRFLMWPHGDSEPRWVERITNDEADARDQFEGLRSMLSPHDVRPCDVHVWQPSLERRGTRARVYNVFVCPGCGWMDGRTAWCCGQPQCRVDDPNSPTGTMALRCEAMPFVAVPDLPAELGALVVDVGWERVDA